MAYTTPRTWVASETVTAALMNTHVRDNISFLKTQTDYALTKNLWIGNWTPRETAGAGAPAVLTAGSNYFSYIPFDKDSIEYAYANVPMPVNYDGGTITAKFYWSHPATTTNFGVRWAIAATSMADNEALNTALGNAIGVTDTGGTAGNLYVSAATAAVTIAGSPDDFHLVHFDIWRYPTYIDDTLAVDAYLHGVLITYGVVG